MCGMNTPMSTYCSASACETSWNRAVAVTTSASCKIVWDGRFAKVDGSGGASALPLESACAKTGALRSAAANARAEKEKRLLMGSPLWGWLEERAHCSRWVKAPHESADSI